MNLSRFTGCKIAAENKKIFLLKSDSSIQNQCTNRIKFKTKLRMCENWAALESQGGTVVAAAVAVVAAAAVVVVEVLVVLLVVVDPPETSLQNCDMQI